MNEVALYGGLGNQMFQYAFAVALNQKGKKTRVSITNYLYDEHHNGFNLGDAFKLELGQSSKITLYILRHGRFLYKNSIARSAFRRGVEAYHKYFCKVYKEKREFEFDRDVFEQDASFFLGVWQVEAYFKNLRSKILDVYQFKLPIDKENILLSEKIKNCNSVSLHVRRGDYLNKNWAESLIVIKNNNYYNNAVAYINAKIQDPHYFIFSDDMEWVKNNLEIEACTYVEHNTGKQSFVDMYLMTLCKHNIIANSSFSWWGAWLNKNENKIVVMPEKWFNREFCEGIFPEEWIKMKV
jgi:hypothetical protein